LKIPCVSFNTFYSSSKNRSSRCISRDAAGSIRWEPGVINADWRRLLRSGGNAPDALALGGSF
jgi:hypothetical protein